MTALSSVLIRGAALAALLVASTAQAEFRLDPRFTDADGDMVADIPTDESQLVDPDTLIFAYTPVEDPAIYADVWDGFIEHLSEATGKPVQFFPVQSNAAQLEAMRAGRLHIAGVNTGGNPIAVACAGFRPFAMMAAMDGSYGYEMEIITHPDSGITEVADLAGKNVAFTSETSNSGFKAPSALLASEFDLTAGEDFQTAFSGAHDNSILGVANKDYDAAAIANSVMGRMMERGVVSQDQIVSVYKSGTFPTTGYGVVYNLTPELQQQIQDAFFSFDWEGSGLAEEFGSQGEEQFIPISFQEHWAVIRDIDAAMNVSYDCQ
ncbi:phosphate/phosphite/phosphonate ABC transporter substrate-binding protein [Aureimonas mangrovi]|uniref:phosphate/phosphite/phosphonate ABC transporter substrate-binding protein n=1 Tax=Aureimonas mangrovi TaxID=2758041 RepID=UPI00163D9BDA|nr:phosphate/phosphite/phosphonate ABC transporter substrate-binding protein [Aureimonas mangrovi]